MQLVIDIGNTRVKAALFQQKEVKYFFVFDSPDPLLEAGLARKYKVENCIIGSVVN